ncbi:MAG: ATP-grasp domain-containing protein [Ilumatobacteraceae bacterium]
MATCREALGLDTDMPLVEAALQRLDVVSDVLPWDAAVDWSRFALVVIRSTWDYHRRHQEFLQWVRSVSRVTRLANSSDIIVWNTDKRYLEELAGAGVPTVPTTFVAPGDVVPQVVIDTLFARGDVVVKPTISAGSNDTERHGDIASMRAHLEALHRAGRTAMVQPYLHDVDTASETGLVYIDGRYSHAFAKGPMLRDPKTMAEGLYAEERIDVRRATTPELSLGERVIQIVTERFGTPLYARVDLLPTPDGPVIIEVEMTEPSLYVHVDGDAAGRLADAILRRCA